MKKTIKLLISILLLFTIVISLAGCGGQTAKPEVLKDVKNQEAYGLTIDVPNELGDFTEDKENRLMKVLSVETGSSIVISDVHPADGVKSTDLDLDTYKKVFCSSFTDLNIIEYKNDSTLLDSPAVYVNFKATNSLGGKVEMYHYIIFYKNNTFQTIAFGLDINKDNFLKKNLKAIVNSIKVKK